MGRILDFIRSLDQIGSPFELNFGKESRFKTSTGGVLSILGIILVIIAFVYLILKVLDQKEVEVSMNTQYLSTYPKIDLYENKIFPFFGLVDQTTGRQVPVDQLPRFINARGYIWMFNYTSLQRPETIVRKTLAEIPFKPCKEITDPLKDELYSKFVNARDYGETFGLCPDLSQHRSLYAVEGNLNQPPFIKFVVHITPCLLGPPPACASTEQMEGAELNLFTASFSFDPENRENPIQVLPIVGENPRIVLSTRIQKVIRLKTTEIKDDDQEFGDETPRKTFSDIDRVIDNFDSRAAPLTWCTVDGTIPCHAFITLDYQSGTKKVVIKRAYKKLISTLGEVGGINEMVMLGIGVLYLIYVCSKAENRLKKEMLRKEPLQYKKYIGGSDKDVQELVDDLLEENLDGIQLFRRLNQLAVLEALFFDDEVKELLPKVLLKLKRQERLGGDGAGAVRGEASIEEAYQKLKAHRPKNELQRVLKEFMLKNLDNEALKGGTETRLMPGGAGEAAGGFAEAEKMKQE